MAHRFKIGDKVRLKPYNPKWRNEGPSYIEEMQDLPRDSPLYIIDKFHPMNSDKIHLQIGFYWDSSWLEPAKKKVFK